MAARPGRRRTSSFIRNRNNRSPAPHGGHGRRAEHDIAEQFETQTGHLLGDQSAAIGADDLGGDTRPSDTDPTGVQHARKGQAQSPRELNLNQPEKKRDGHS